MVLADDPAGVALREAILLPDGLDRLLASVARGLQVSRGDVRQHLLLQRQARQEAAQPRVLALKVLHPACMIDLQAAVLFALAVVALLGELRLIACERQALSIHPTGVPTAVRGVRERIEAVGALLLYLPAYSPDFNPIELAFAKLKALLRSAAARTTPDLWDAIRRSLTRFTPAECRAYLAPPLATTQPDRMSL